MQYNIIYSAKFNNQSHRFSEINEMIKSIRNHKKIKDISKTLECYDSLVKIYSKSKAVIEKSGSPKAFIRCIADLEVFIQEVSLFKITLNI